MTKREQILVALVSLLAGTTGVGTRIFRSREDALSIAESPSIIVMPENEQDNGSGVIGPIDKNLLVSVSVYARGAQPDTAADPVIESAYSKIMASTTVGGLAIDIQEAGTAWDFAQADQNSVMVTTRFIIWYRHSRDSLAS